MSRRKSAKRGYIVVLGSHEMHGYSMTRYTRLLESGYARSGVAVRVVRPSSRLSRRVRSSALRKFVSYVEQLVLFPPVAWWQSRGAVATHVADHSDALWLLALGRRPAIVTCHDLIAVRASLGEIPEHRTRWSGRVYQRLVQAGLRRADLVIAVSDATAADVRRLIRGVTVKVLHNPVDADALATDLRALADTAPYALVVSSSGWRKRRRHAVDVWRRIDSKWAGGLRLIVVGPPLSAEEAAGLSADTLDRISVRTGVDDLTLAQLYAGAEFLIQVSKYEGFGWPIVEANLYGTVAVCSDSAVFREVGGVNEFINDDLDSNDWDRLIQKVRRPESADLARLNALRFGFSEFSRGLSALHQAHAEEAHR